MFTAEKSRLFFNDPKFQEIEKWDMDSQEGTVKKIFAGQRQLRRSKVANGTLSGEAIGQDNKFMMLDFLQSRMNAFQQRLVLDVEDLFVQKERIKEKYSEAESLYDKSNRKLRKLTNSVKTEPVNFEDIEELEKEVTEIQKIYQENQFLKSMNSEIKTRIAQKQVQLGSLRK